jgi:hypothetical protein
MSILNDSLVGWATIGSAAFWILQYIFLGLMFSIATKPYGRLSDITFVIAALLMVPFTAAFYNHFRPENQLASWLGLLVGLAGIGYFSIAQIHLVSGQITFTQNMPQAMLAFGLMGVSLLLFNLLARADPQFPAGLIWLGVIFSAFMAQGVLTSSYFNQQILDITSGSFNFSGLNPIMYLLLVALAISQVGYPVWAIWLGRLILRGEINF